MYIPEELGRLAREHNHEAMSYMREATGHIVKANQKARAVLKMPISEEVRDLILASLEESDLAIVALINGTYHQREIEGIHDQNAARGKYEVKG